MKTKKLLIFSVLLTMAFVSCTQEDVLNSESNLKTLSASVEHVAESRVGFTDAKDAKFFWTKGDKIGVTTASSQTFQGMTLQGEGGEATGTFSASMSAAASGYAVYPYGSQGRHSVSNDKLTYALLDEFTYDKLDATYGNSKGNSHNAPMWGKISNGAVTFKHLGGVIAFSVSNLPANTKGLKFVLTATNQICGNFEATLTETEPMIIAKTTGVADDEKKVTINFSTAEGQTSGYFYVPVPTGALGNLSLVILNGEEEVATGAWDNITITRKDIRRANIGSQSIVGGDGEIKQVASVADVTSALSTSEKTLTVQVSDEVAGTTDNTITIPANLSTNTTTLSFASVANDAKITINEASVGSYTGKIVIEIPEGETLPEVLASVPNGEVYIKQGTVTTLVVDSASETTIIGATAKIGTLTVVKGNVRIEDGGQVGTINRSSSYNETVNVIYESATVPTINLGQGVVLVSAAEWDLRKAVAAGGAVTLGADVTLTSTLEINNTLTLNLGGFTITNKVENTSTDVIVVGENGNLTINGEGNVTAVSGNDGYPVISAGTLTINGGTFTTGSDAQNEANACIYARGNGKVYINGGEFKGPDGDKFIINKKDADRATTTIEIAGGKFYAGFNPADNEAENAGTNFVKTGYSSVEREGYFEVVEGIHNEAALKLAVAAGGEVTLGADVTLTSTLEINNKLTLNLGGFTITNKVENTSTDVIVVGENGNLTINGEGYVTA